MTEAMTTVAEQPGDEEFNPYLHGPYAPRPDELTAAGLEVVGEIPLDLDGVFLRNGPNPQHAPPGRYHWFDGDGMVHAVDFRDGQATYRNRWVRTRSFELEQQAGGALFSGVMEHPKGNPDLGLRLPLKDSANTDLVVVGDRVIALWYLAGEPYTLDPVSLAPAPPFAALPDGVQMSAHAKFDEATGELLFFDYGPRRPFMRYGVVGSDGALAHLTDIDLPGPRLPHDMAVTENYAILMDLPLVNDDVAAREGRHRIVFKRDQPSRFGVVGRRADGTTVRWFEADPCYIYHSVNAWEEGDEIVLDVCRVTKPAPRDGAGPLARMLSYLRVDAHMYRYRFNLATGATHEQQLDDENSEFPSMDNRRLGRKSRYSYNMHIAPDPTLLFDALVRYDTETGATARYEFGPGRWGSEAPFAPRPGATGEDDGYVVSFVHDESAGRSEVVILDAADIAAGPVGRVLLPTTVPIGFHAAWARGDQIGGDR